MNIRLRLLFIAWLLPHVCVALDDNPGVINLINNPLNPVIDGRTGELVEGGLVLAGLYYSTDMEAVPAPGQAGDGFQLAGTSVIDPPSPDLNGIWFPKLIELPGTAPGQYVLVQIRVWSLPHASYEQAFQSPGALIGASSLLNPMRLGGGPTPAPSISIQGGLTSIIIYPNDIIPLTPIARSFQFDSYGNEPVTGQLFGSDPQGKPLTYIQLTDPAAGTLIFRTDGSFQYTPMVGFFGMDEFSYKVSNGEQESQPATARIEMHDSNNLARPVVQISPISSLTYKDGPLLVVSSNNTNATVVLDGSLSSDVDGDLLQFAWVTGQNLIPISTEAITLVPFDLGTHSISLFVDDGGGLSMAQTVIEIISSHQAVGEVISQVDEANLGKGKRHALKSTLHKAEDFFEHNQFEKGAHQLEVFLSKIRTQIQPNDPALADHLKVLAEEILAGL